MIKQTINYNNQNIEITWYQDIDFHKLKNITQVYGVIFNEKEEILIISIKKDIWTLPGGTPEKEDKNWEETLRREVLEESNVEIENIIPIGYQNSTIVGVPNSEHQQLRYTAKVKRILSRKIDPATGIIPEIKFIKPEDFLDYCPWGKIGKEIIKLAKEKYLSNQKHKI